MHGIDLKSLNLLRSDSVNNIFNYQYRLFGNEWILKKLFDDSIIDIDHSIFALLLIII